MVLININIDGVDTTKIRSMPSIELAIREQGHNLT